MRPFLPILQLGTNQKKPTGAVVDARQNAPQVMQSDSGSPADN